MARDEPLLYFFCGFARKFVKCVGFISARGVGACRILHCENFNTLTIMNGILELLTNRYWMVMPEFVHGIRAELQHNLATHAALNLPEKVMGYPVSVNDGRILDGYGRYDKVNEPFINVEVINGPITRNGDACSYGSRDHRDMMMLAAESPFCVGHIFVINTPGGSAWAKNDYQQGIEYAHQKGQKVVAFVDGLCASAGMYLAALCDERYYMNPNNEIGCIGVMAAFYTEADGSRNQFTNETYHELYDPESFDKNREFRDVANDGDAKLMIEELAALGVEFRADVKRACPNATEEHLHGRIFKASEVDGILMDGQKSLAEVMEIVVKGSKNPTLKQNGGDPMAQALEAGEKTAENIDNILSNQNNTIINMKEQFPAVFAQLGVEAMECGEEGTFFNAELLGTLNGKIEAMQQEAAQAKELAESLTQEKSELTAKVEEMTAQAETKEAEHAKAIEDLNTAHATVIEDKNSAIAALEQEKADLETELNGVKESLTTAETTIAERDAAIAEKEQTITDLNATIEEMKQDAGEGAQAGSPANNGAGADTPKVVVGRYVYNNELTYEQNLQAEEEWNAKHNK